MASRHHVGVQTSIKDAIKNFVSVPLRQIRESPRDTRPVLVTGLASTWFGNKGVRPPVPTGQSLRTPGRMSTFLPILYHCVRAFLCSVHSATQRLALVP